MIGWYVHHHGVGHQTRADAIARALDEPVTVLSSRPRPPGHAAAAWIDLPLDTDTHAVQRDPTAHEVLHWAPHGVAGLTDRMAAIADWVATAAPSVVVVDVSVEVALFVRLMGIPVVVVAMPGRRDDPVHTLAYRLATHIIAPWSRDVYDPAWLHPFAATTTYTGSISRFDGRSRIETDSPRTVVVLGAAGGTTLTADAVADWSDPRFRTRPVGVGAGRGAWIDDVWPVLSTAAVVVTHAGQNAVADVAAAGVPAIVVPQDRPFDEQVATADALAAAGIAVVSPTWPRPAQWSEVLDRALALDPRRWAELRTVGAASRAADAVSRAAGITENAGAATPVGASR